MGTPASIVYQGIRFTLKEVSEDNAINLDYVSKPGSVPGYGYDAVNKRHNINIEDEVTTKAELIDFVNTDSAMQAVFTNAELELGDLSDSLTEDGGPAAFTGGAITTPGKTETATLTITDVSVGTFIVTLTNPAKNVTVNVVNGETATQVATKIVDALGSVAGYNVTNNNDGTITFKSTTDNTNVADLTVTISE